MYNLYRKHVFNFYFIYIYIYIYMHVYVYYFLEYDKISSLILYNSRQIFYFIKSYVIIF